MREHCVAYLDGRFYVMAKDPHDAYWWAYLETNSELHAATTVAALNRAHLGDEAVERINQSIGYVERNKTDNGWEGDADELLRFLGDA